ncbi:MAG: gamma-glutamyltransferase [Nevskia sp.]|nr:gamma-glutamyltransferase [Nevskia sp.]
MASAHPLATDAGIEILQSGGNAFDAAVAVSAALSVVEPYSSGIGGGGFWLLHRQRDGFETMVDGRETAPRAASREMYQDAQGHAIADLSRNGPIAGAIPGTPAALDLIAARYGRLGLARDLQPAIRLARDGFPLDKRFAGLAALLASRLSPAARDLLVPDGKPLAEGALLRQPDLAQTLQRLAEQGRDGFYTGVVAQRLVDGVKAGGGIWSRQDLLDYRVAERRPIVFRFQDYRIVTAPPPSAGGIGLAEILDQLAAVHWSARFDRTRSDQLVIEAMRRAYRDRAAYLGDPDYIDMPLKRLLSPAYARALAATIEPGKATPSSALPPPGQTGRAAREGADTTHYSIIDGEGNRVSATVTVNLPFGSAYMAPGTGVFVNDEMDDFAASVADSNAYGLIGSSANAIAPGKRPLSSMSPSFVEGPNGVLVIGTPGGSRIVTMVLLGMLDFVRGADASHIVGGPRFHMQFLPDRVQFEAGAFDAAEQSALKQMGYSLDALSGSYGNMQVVLWRRAGNTLEAAADPREVGTGRVVSKKPWVP